MENADDAAQSVSLSMGVFRYSAGEKEMPHATFSCGTIPSGSP
jgi:hypothetical protein